MRRRVTACLTRRQEQAKAGQDNPAAAEAGQVDLSDGRAG